MNSRKQSNRGRKAAHVLCNSIARSFDLTRKCGTQAGPVTISNTTVPVVSQQRRNKVAVLAGVPAKVLEQLVIAGMSNRPRREGLLTLRKQVEA